MTRPTTFLAAMAAVSVVLSGAPSPANADDRAFVAAVNAHLRSVRAAQEVTARSQGNPDAVQHQYDAARDFVESLRASGRTSGGCRPAAQAAMQLAEAEVLQTEGYDLPDPGVVASATRQINAAVRRYNIAAGSCTQTGQVPGSPPVALTSPATGQAFFGTVRVAGKAPNGARWAVATKGHDPPSCASSRTVLRVVDREVEGSIALPMGHHRLTVTYCGGSTVAPRSIGAATVDDVWVLANSERYATPPRTESAGLDSRLTQLSRTFTGISGVWYQDLSSGVTASWNADAQFPAASTVKLGLLVAALERFGVRSPVSYDIQAMATWSSNLATNRLLVKVGGSETGGAAAAQAALTRMGATRSTFTGGYRVGTALSSQAAEPPRISSRVTTARDLGRMLYLIHSGAIGNQRALLRLHLTRAEAAVALGFLLSSEPKRDNIGLFRPALGKTTPAAQKQGWFSVVRHTAAIVYTPTGPKIVVLLTYAPNLTLSAAQAYGARLIRLLPV
jgi:beta-lactamase class A